jgi:hypothetical protein
MRIVPGKPMSDQLIGRLHQCSFLLRNYDKVGIELSEIRLRLIKSFGKKLGDHYKSLITFGGTSCFFTISNFDMFLKQFFESFDEELDKTLDK